MKAPYGIGSKIWPGLSKLVEEAGEMLQQAGRIMALGGERDDHWDGKNVRGCMLEEVSDLLAATEWFIEHNFVGLNRVAIRERADEKKKQYDAWHRERKEY